MFPERKEYLESERIRKDNVRKGNDVLKRLEFVVENMEKLERVKLDTRYKDKEYMAAFDRLRLRKEVVAMEMQKV